MIRISKPSILVVEVESNGIRETFDVNSTTLKCENDIIYLMKPGRTYEFRRIECTKPLLPAPLNLLLYDVLVSDYFNPTKDINTSLIIAMVEFVDTTYMRTPNSLAITPRCQLAANLGVNYSGVDSDMINAYELDILISFNPELDSAVLLKEAEREDVIIPAGTQKAYLSELYQSERKTVEDLISHEENYAFQFLGLVLPNTVSYKIVACEAGQWNEPDANILELKTTACNVSIISIDDELETIIEETEFVADPETAEIDYDEIDPEPVAVEVSLTHPEEINLPDDYLHDIRIDFGAALAADLKMILTIDDDDPLPEVKITAGTLSAYLSKLISESRDIFNTLAGSFKVFNFEFKGFTPGAKSISFATGLNVSELYSIQTDIDIALAEINITVVLVFADLADLMQADSTMTITDATLAVTDAEPAEFGVSFEFPEFAGVESDVEYDVKVDFGGALANAIQVQIGEFDPVEVALGETSVMLSTLMGTTPEAVAGLSEETKMYDISITGLAIAVHELTITAEITQGETTEVVGTVETEITVTAAE